MRIVSGSARGVTLRVPKGRGVRPTQERVKEAVFNIIASRFTLEGARVLDLFAGGGSLGLEALSRGAAEAVFVEPNGHACRVLQANLCACRLERSGRILHTTTARALAILEREGKRFSGVFLDPPYDQGWVDKTLRLLARRPILEDGAWVVVEHSAAERGRERYPPLALTDSRRYGTTWVSFYTLQPEVEEPQ
jgi:16S rRNA (guanine(966)-N(2))-methyltransferase RsmD